MSLQFDPYNPLYLVFNPNDFDHYWKKFQSKDGCLILKSMKKAIPKRVSLNICSTPHYAEPCATYKRNHPMVYHNAAIYLNNRRISGRRDYNGRVIHFTQVNVKDVLEAMNIPEEIINKFNLKMKTIYKYPLEPVSEQTYAMPKGAKILSVQWIRGQVCIYALVDTDEKMSEIHQFLIIGTGHLIRPNTEPTVHYFLGTVHNEDQSLVFHIFEKKEQ